MSFTDAQMRQLKAPIRRRHVREREAEGKTLHYLEGWWVVSEANRIFGFDAWEREAVSSECVWRSPVGERFGAAYLTRVRISVRAGERVIIREGLGAGEAVASSPGQAHERASKAAEAGVATSTEGREVALLPVYLPSPSPPQRVDKSVLAIPEPRRLRDRRHLKFVAKQACLVCGRSPSQAHHLRIAQPRALGRKVSDEYTVPLCALHHHDLHMRGNEGEWWWGRAIEPLPIAERLWRESRGLPDAGETGAP